MNSCFQTRLAGFIKLTYVLTYSGRHYVLLLPYTRQHCIENMFNVLHVITAYTCTLRYAYPVIIIIIIIIIIVVVVVVVVVVIIICNLPLVL